MTAAIRKETIATVPTLETASPESTKIPAAIIVPTPIAIAPTRPMFASSSSPILAPAAPFR